jgi:uracil-DNA glycosylase family 4
MSEQPQGTPTPGELARQLQQHLQSLGAAGVAWLPTRAPASAAPTEAAPSPEPAAVAAVSSEASSVETAAPVLQPLLFDVVAAPEGETLEKRRQELTVLAEQVAACTRCPELAATRTQTVFGVGPLDPDLCFVGEAPGATEDRRGEPFVGDAGQLLNRIIAACGLKREEVYICNIIRCRPPGNRLPLANEAGNCREYLERQIELVRPKFICALGACAAQNLLRTTQGIGKLRGRFHEFRGIPVMCTYHPASLLPSRSPERKKDVWEDMKKLLARMGRPIPGQK